ncbi:alpha/beta hydrolase [Mycoplasmatota bacterium]|nr:alpha/beta hydrolase [Mycoplasmatota bacterium]
MEKKNVELVNKETYAYLEQGKGNKNLILVHGNTASSLYFKPLLERLPEDIHVFAIDLRGFGDSTYHQPIESLQELADDIYLFMEKLDIDKADVLGWSLGGGVVMEFAAKYPEKLEKLILLNSASYKGYPVFKKDKNNQMIVGEVYDTKEELAKDPVQVLPLLNAYQTKNKDLIKTIYNMTIYNVNKPNDKDFDLFAEETLKQRNLVDVDFALASLNMGKEPTLYAKGSDTIEQIEAETLHIWGSHDVMVPESMIQTNVKGIKNSTYVKFDQCGHSPMVDKPDQLVKVLLDFIQ